MIIANPLWRKQLWCKKNTFCDCSQDLSDLCLTCLERDKVNKVHCQEENPVGWD